MEAAPAAPDQSMRLDSLRTTAISIAAVLVLLIGSAGQALACTTPPRNENLNLSTSVDVPSLAPSIGLTLGVDHQSAIPGNKLTYTVVVTNSSTALTIAGSLEARNSNAVAATIGAWYDFVSTDPKGSCGDNDQDSHGRDKDNWIPMAGTAGAKTGYTPIQKVPIATGMTLTAVAVAAKGVKYATGADTISGTSISAGATARWKFTAVIPLTNAQAASLFKGPAALPIRENFHAEPTSGIVADSDAATLESVNFCRQLTALKNTGNATKVSVGVTLPDGTVRTIDKSTVAALASIAPGASATVTTTYTVPVLAAKGASETDATYLARLTALSGKTLSASASAKAGNNGPTAGPVGPITTTEILPVLSLSKTGPATVDPGKTATYALVLANTGSAAAASVTLVDSLPNGTTIGTTGAPASLTPAATATAHATYAVPSSQPAGNLTDTAVLRWTDATGNRYGPISSQATSRVTRPTATVIVTASSGSLTYGGTVPAITPSYSGWLSGDGPAVLTTAPICSTTATNASGVGTYKTTCSGAAAPNYTFTYVDGSVTVTPALVTVTASSGSMTYGGAVPVTAPSYSGWVKGQGPSVLTTEPVCATAATSASPTGTYSSSCSGAAAANYTFAYVDGSVKVNPALVTVTASSGSMTYGGTVPVITPAYSGLANGEGPSVLTTEPVCATAATSTSSTGTYSSSCSGAAAANYTFTYVGGTISVNPSSVIVTASSGSLTYGGTVPAITPSYSGWLSGDGPAVLTTAPICSTTATNASGVGTYKTTCSGAAAPNYTFTYVDGSVTVTPALVTVTASSGSMTYGGAVPVTAPSYSGWVKGQGPSVLTTEPVCATAATSASPTGTYSSSCSGAAAANYTFAYVDGSVIVNPTLVIVTASSGSMTYGGTVPAITASYSGWVGGDGPSVLASAPTCSTAATSTSLAGTYSSSCSGAVAANYTFDYVDGTISVTNAEPDQLTLAVSPREALPLGATVTITLKATDGAGAPLANGSVHIGATGANATATDLITDANGTATYTYIGANSGTDQLQATATGGSGQIASNTVAVIWFAPAAPLTTSNVHAKFYPSDFNTHEVTVTSSWTPAFEQDFPNVGLNYWNYWMTRPVVDVTTDMVGNITGTIEAQGNGYVAGQDTLVTFNTVFTGTFTVAAAGKTQIRFGVDDNIILGVGGGATDASGLGPWTPLTTPIAGYPVDTMTPASGTAIVYFPAPGVYPFEVDYVECCGGPLYVTMNRSDDKPVSSTVSLTMSPIYAWPANTGTTKTLAVSALGPDGKPLSNQPIDVSIVGANSAEIKLTTDGSGIAQFTYRGKVDGTDAILATTAYGGIAGESNVVNQTWATPSGVPPSLTGVGPAEGSIITAPTPITATVAAPAGQTIDHWTVSYTRVGTTAGPVTIASGDGAPPSATLGTFDPTVLPNGAYTITVSVYASDGVGSISNVGVTVEGNLKLGRYGVTYTDANVAVGGIPMQVQRTYDSFNKAQGDFGIGWRLGLANFRIYTNGPLGAEGWSQYETSCFMAGLGGGLCQMAWTTARPHMVSVVWPDGHTEIFDFTPSGGDNLFWLGSAAFTARAGSTSKLAVSGDASLSYNGNGNLYGGMSGPVFDPTRFTLTAKDGTIYVLDTVSGLVSETDRSGNSVTVDASGVHSSLGPSITFVRDSSGRINELDQPGGAKVLYAYDAAGDLTGVTDERGKTVTYHYDAAHDLTDTVDPDGHPLRTLTYGTDGRLKTIADGAGNVSTLTLDPNARTEMVTGPDPRLTTVTSMNQRGDIERIDQIFGGKTLTTAFKVDDFGHVLSKTDPLGHMTEATYDAAGSPLTLTEPDNGTWTFTYDDHENLTSVSDRTQRQIATLKYDSYGELTKKTTPDGDVIYTYGGHGLLASVTDTLVRTTTYGYDSAGHVASVTGPDGRIWGYSYDANGKTKTVTNPASEITTFHYDDAGNLAWFKDALGHGQTYSYDDLGRLATVTDALSRDTTYTYTPAGQIETILDRNSATTRFAYDASGNLTQVTLPGGSALTYTYDPLGQMTKADDADATLAFTYDDAGSLKTQTSGGTATSNQPTVALTFGRDTAGRPTSVIGPWGTTTYAYDAEGLLKTVTDPSSGVFTFGYDPLGRLASLSRPNGISDAYVYKPTGELSSRTSSQGSTVIDALSYTYG